MMSTDSNLKQTAPTVTATAIKPSVQQTPVEIVSTNNTFNPSDYNGAVIVKLRLLNANTMQYDAEHKLKLDSTEPTEMPLTPFFASRIGKTVEICE